MCVEDKASQWEQLSTLGKHRHRRDKGVRMGGWKLEVGKMAMYMSFPVMLFYVFNQPKYFEEWTVRTRRELYPPVDKMHYEEIEGCIRKIHERKERELLQSLEDDGQKN